MRYFLLVGIVSALIGCVSHIQPHSTSEVVMLDNPSEELIEISVKNNTDDQICIASETWPNQFGEIHFAYGWVFLMVDQNRFSIKDFNTGSCPKGCEPILVRSGKTLKAKIPYRNFDLPNKFYDSP